MKKEVLAKIAIASALGATACAGNEHRNEIISVKQGYYRTVILMRDINDGFERYFVCTDNKYDTYKYFIGDTVTVKVGGLLNDSYYRDNDVLHSQGNDCRMFINQDSLIARQKREAMNFLNHKPSKTK